MAIEKDWQQTAYLAAIIASSADAIIGKDLNGFVLSWNPSAEKIFGYKSAEIIGQHISVIIPPDRLTEEEMIIAVLKEGKVVEHFQTIRVHKDGRQIHVSLSISPIRNEEGEIIGASKIVRDITGQKATEEKLQQYTFNLEAINAVSRSLATFTDEEKILQEITDTTTKLSGAAFGAFFYNKTDVKGQSYMLYTLSGAPRSAFEKFGMPRNTAVFSKTFNGEGIYRSDDITQDARYGKNPPHRGMPEGHLPVVSYLAVPVISPTGIVIGGLFFGHPEKARFTEEHETLIKAISSIAAVALDKARLYEEIQFINKKKDDFISYASHELKNPLATLYGYLQMGEQGLVATEELMLNFKKQIGRLRAIISDLLDLTKIQSGALTLQYTTVSLTALVQDAVDAVKAVYPQYHFHCHTPSPDVKVPVDTQKMGQVLVNLLSNAAKYSAAPSTVTIEAHQIGEQVQIAITDHGKGMDEEALAQIFNQYYRVEGEKKKTEGLGLGLYIAKEIMAAHHGHIDATSKLGEGSVFTISFPLVAN